MADEKLSEETKKAEADEKSRKERLEKIREERKGAGTKGLAFETKDWNGILNKGRVLIQTLVREWPPIGPLKNIKKSAKIV